MKDFVPLHIMLKHAKDVAEGKAEIGQTRSGRWPKVRADHLKSFPTCAVCGGTRKIEVHHVRPFHLHPELELDPTNLITLCESGDDGANCHLHYGHLGNFKSFNVDVIEDSRTWAKKIEGRPKGDKGV